MTINYGYVKIFETSYFFHKIVKVEWKIVRETQTAFPALCFEKFRRYKVKTGNITSTVNMLLY